jgi:hypothetical protein
MILTVNAVSLVICDQIIIRGYAPIIFTRGRIYILSSSLYSLLMTVCLLDAAVHPELVAVNISCVRVGKSQYQYIYTGCIQCVCNPQMR